MMGYSHAMTGAAAWLALTSTSNIALGVYDPGSNTVVLAGSLLCAGAAMVPDADHGEASIAHALPPVSKWMAEGVGAVSGGHRHGTHSFIGIIAFALITYLASFWTVDIHGRTVAAGAGVLAILLIAFATKTFGLHRNIGTGAIGSILGSSIGPWIVAVGTAGAATYFLDEKWAWLTICVAVGAFIHVVGDGFTEQGVPWLWPWNPKPPKWVRSTPILKELWLSNGYFRLPILGKTGGDDASFLDRTVGKRRGRQQTSWQEVTVVSAVTLYALYLLAYEFLRFAGIQSVLF